MARKSAPRQWYRLFDTKIGDFFGQGDRKHGPLKEEAAALNVGCHKAEPRYIVAAYVLVERKATS